MNEQISDTHTVIIGGGVAGFRTADTLRAMDEKQRITVFTREDYGECSTCAIPFVIGGELKDFEEMILHTPEDFEKKDIEVIISEVEEIHVDEGFLLYAGGKRIDFNNLVLATGRRPFVPPVPGTELNGVFTLSSLNKARRAYPEIIQAERVVVVGAGAIGLEVAAALNAHAEVTVVELLPNIFPRSLDPDMASYLQSHLEEKGIRILISTSLLSVNGHGKGGNGEVESVTLEPPSGEKREIPADIVVMSAGIRPEASLAEKAGISIGPTGGIETMPTLNAKQGRRILENVYAVGDCAEVKDGITFQPTLSPLASTAVRQAYIVAHNLSHEKSMVFAPTLSPNISLVAGMQMGSVGLTEAGARMSGLKVKASIAEGWTRSRYCPGRKKIRIKLIALGDRLIGAQFLSEEDVKERVNLTALSISQGLSILALASSERAYAPPMSLLTDPMVNALRKLMDKK